eukprot:TRINITY_DN4805_c0_g1_i2.p1 TRINITY_DN4805_c0_g1~~TRINITY_DN4805_c0_g1_i2.p1  ORF type:complete len:463 (-),score=123.60 TRINITY_DN4805_c0_g1_i2:13-1401(-)
MSNDPNNNNPPTSGKSPSSAWMDWRDDDLAVPLEQIVNEAPIIPPDNDKRIDLYLRSAHRLFLKTNTQYHGAKSNSEKELAYILLLRFVNLIIHTIPKHKEIKDLDETQRKDLADLRNKCSVALNHLEKVKGYQKQKMPPSNPTPQSQPQVQHLPGIPAYQPSNVQLPTIEPVPTSDQKTEPQSKTNLRKSASEHPALRTMADFSEISKLGEGGFAACFKMMDNKTHNICVVKKIPFTTVDDVFHISTEIQILRKLSHPGIVGYLATFMDGNNMCMAMEFCDVGDLKDWISHRQPRWTPVDLKLFQKWAEMMTSAMTHVHHAGILHRDLKPSNILLKKISDSEIVPKIADFGLSYQLMTDRSRASTIAGTLIYWPPEVYAGEKPGKPADVYSMGCIFYEMLVGTSRPATSLLLHEKKKGLLSEICKHYNRDIEMLIARMVEDHIEDRPTFEAVNCLLRNDFK